MKRCKNCHRSLHQEAEKAIGDGEWQMVWAAPDGDWVCRISGEEHEPVEGIDFTDPTTWDRPLTDEDALSLAIFALNTLAEPEASTEAQIAALDFFTEGALEHLVELRDKDLTAL